MLAFGAGDLGSNPGRTTHDFVKSIFVFPIKGSVKTVPQGQGLRSSLIGNGELQDDAAQNLWVLPLQCDDSCVRIREKEF